MTTEKRTGSPSDIPENLAFSRTDFNPFIPRHASSSSPYRSEVESEASGSAISSTASRPPTRQLTEEAPLQPPTSNAGSSIVVTNRTTGSHTERDSSRASTGRALSMPAGEESELVPHTFFQDAPFVSTSTPEIPPALQTPSDSNNITADTASSFLLPVRGSRNSSIVTSPPMATETRNPSNRSTPFVLKASDDAPAISPEQKPGRNSLLVSTSAPLSDESTPLILNVGGRAHNRKSSSFQLPAYLQCNLLSNIFSWIYQSAAEFIDSLRWENFTRPFGSADSDIIRITVLLMWIDNFVGMIAQGLLGGLNAEDFATTHIKDAIFISISALVIFSIAAMEGKRRLVGMFNQMAAERMPERITEFPANVTRYDIALSIATWPIKIVISSVFSVLAEVSLSEKYGAAGVLLKYQKPWANSIAAFLTSFPVTTIAMFSALTINLIGFPTKFALLTLLTSLDQAMQTPAYKRRQTHVQRYVDALLLHIIFLFENNRHDEINNLMETINDLPPADLMDGIISIVKARGIALPEPESWTQFFKRQIPALIALAISVYGISNFYSIAENFLIPYLQLPKSFGPPAGVMAMAGMAALCFMAVYVPLSSIEHELPVLSRGEKIWNWGKTITMCGLGALTNLQQAIMTNTLTDPAAIAFSYFSAFLSPVLIEAKGYYKYTTTPLIKQRIANDATGQLSRANNAVEFFQSQRNAVTNLSEETLHTHYEKAVGRDNNPAERPSKYIHTAFFKSMKSQQSSVNDLESGYAMIEHRSKGKGRGINS